MCRSRGGNALCILALKIKIKLLLLQRLWPCIRLMESKMQVFTFKKFCCCCCFSEWEKRKIGISFLGMIPRLSCCLHWDATSSPVCSVCKWLKRGRKNFHSITCTASASPWVLEQCLEEHFPLLISNVKFWLKTSSDYSNRKAFLSLKATHSSGRKGWVLSLKVYLSQPWGCWAFLLCELQ